MADPIALRSFLVSWLENKGLAGHALVWKWKLNHPNVDYAVSLHAFRMDLTTEEALQADAQKQMQDAEAIFFEQGFLNIRFSPSNWLALWTHWCMHPKSFLEAAEIPQDIGAETILWRYRLLKVLQEAAVLAHIDGWLPADLSGYRPSAREIGLLKSLLSLGGLLHQKSELPQKRLQIMMQIQELVSQMWVDPILTPVDPLGSAYRQGILRLAMYVAEVVGSPFTQSLEASIPLHFERPRKRVE